MKTELPQAVRTTFLLPTRNVRKIGVIGVFSMIFVVFLTFRSNEVTASVNILSPAAPTNVTASDNSYNSKVGIYWDAIRGATIYRIFRATSNVPANAIDVGNTASNSFFDTSAVAGQVYFYWIRAENSTGVSALSLPDQGVRSATNSQGGFQPLAPPAAPAGNPLTAAKIYLGKVLFWDEQLSSTRTVACGTCHHAANGGTDPRSALQPPTSMNPGPDNLFNTPDDILGSAGVPVNNQDGTFNFAAPYGFASQVTGRKSISYINAGYSPDLFWDGRASGIFLDPLTNSVVLNTGGALESQIIGPPVSTGEMAHGGRNWTDVAARIAASKPLALSPNLPPALNTWIDARTYPELFFEAFGTAEVTPVRIAFAIASFERSLYSDRAPIDLEAQGIPTLTPQEIRGRALFNSTANNCAVCHSGSRLSDSNYHNIGVRPDTEDIGHELVTGFPIDRSAFRTPGLRNVGLRGSYFHNGRFTTLEQVVDFYDRGGDFDANNKPNLVHPMGLTAAQKSDLVAFLRNALTDPRVATETERFDRPTLYMESNRVPLVTGTGRAGSGGFAPQIKAISPPLVGNPNFTVSVSSAIGNATAILVIDEVDPGTGSTVPASGSFARVTSATQNTGNGNGWTSVTVPIPDNAALIGKTFFARWYITDAGATNGFSVTPAARFTVFGTVPAAPARARFDDFDGDGKTDISVFRPSEGNWYIMRSGDSTVTANNFGISSDTLVPADYDGDGKTDIAVYRNGAWYMQKSRDGFAVATFGQGGDVAQPGDYDGDGIADVAVYRPAGGVWYMQKSRDGFAALQFGIATDKPVSADYDGDGKTDQAVYRDGIWYMQRSTAGFYAAQFGVADDKPVMGDYDGDAKADIAVWRPSTGIWYTLRTSDGTFRGAGFGLSTDIPTPGDYDGDGSNDYAVFRPAGGVWYITNPTTGSFRAQQFGALTDKPVPASIVP